MSERSTGFVPSDSGEDELSLLGLASIVLRSRRMVMALGLTGLLLGLSVGLLSQRQFVSSAIFIPEGSDGGSTSGLAMAASQFGIRIPTSGGSWGPPVYVELLKSRVLLDPIAIDTVVVAEEGGRRAALMDLLEVNAPSVPRRTELTVQALKSVVTAVEDKRLGAVRVSVTTAWPSVSLALAQQLVAGVSQFILKAKKSQAAAERQFVEAQADAAEHALREAENRLQQFSQENRVINGSPGLSFQHDRLQRDMTLRQQIFSTLSQSREDARIREVRDTPVVTVLESPQLPVVGEARNTVKKALLGGFAGLVLGALLSFLFHAIGATRRRPSGPSREFFALIEELTPRFLRR
jgi:uncharacterized protein involved in exopolysaccharide biosynthesis